MSLKKILYYYLPAILYMVLIFWLSSIPNLKFSDTDAEFFRRKIIHVIEYGILWVLLYRAFAGETWIKNFSKNRSSVVLAMILAIVYSISDEVHQSFVPTRNGKIADCIFDSLGVILSWGIFNLFLIRKKNWMKKTKELKKKNDEEKLPLWPIFLGIFLFGSILFYTLWSYDKSCFTVSIFPF